MPKIYEVMSVWDKRVMDSKRVQMMVLNAMKWQGRVLRDEMLLTTQYWKHKVEFAYTMRYRGGDIRLFVGPISSTQGAKIWSYLNDGTSSISVIFNPKYKQKTSYPGEIGNNTPGEYTLPHQRIIGRRMFPTSRGIRARNWTGLLTQRYGSSYTSLIKAAITVGLRPK